jgi:ketosteroid isomerase-like protein
MASSGIIAVCLALSACGGGGAAAPQAVNKDAIAKDIQADERQLLEDYRSRDANKVASHYSDDAVLMITNRPPMSGHDAIVQGMGPALADVNFALDFANQKTLVSNSGDLAYSRGTYNVSYSHPETKQSVTEHGSYVNIYQKQADGTWKIVEDLTSPTAAAAASPAVPA